MNENAYPYIFTSARLDLDCEHMPQRYGKYNKQPCRIIATRGRPGAQLHRVGFPDGTMFGVADYELQENEAPDA